MKYLVGFSRVIVGVLFIISGLIKLNDPMGFSFKLEEYFSSGVLDLPFFEPHALAISLVVVIIEVLLGIMLLIGFKPKLTVWSLLVMIVFFTFLTWYSAYYNKVTDCGCFGDAIKLTPWESFTKDVILLVFILILLIGLKYIKPLFSKTKGWAIFSIVLLACILFGRYVLNHLPVKDFRAYKIGTDIIKGMEVPEGAPKPVYDYAWKFDVNGEEKIIVTQGAYPSVEGEFIGVETTEVQKGYEPPIHDFTIDQDGYDYTEEFMQEEKLLVVISYDLAKSNQEAFSGIKPLAEKANEKGFKVIALSASGSDESDVINQKYGMNLPFYITDQTTLKTIIRSNPGVLVVEKGVIQQKKHYNDIDEIEL